MNATAISLEGGEHDCYVESVIVWSGRVGQWLNLLVTAFMSTMTGLDLLFGADHMHRFALSKWS